MAIRGFFLACVFGAGVVVAPAIQASAAVGPTLISMPVAAAAAPIPLNTSSCYWTNCTEAHQNGEGNIPQGSAHYCSKQDRDSDGIACES